MEETEGSAQETTQRVMVQRRVVVKTISLRHHNIAWLLLCVSDVVLLLRQYCETVMQ